MLRTKLFKKSCWPSFRKGLALFAKIYFLSLVLTLGSSEPWHIVIEEAKAHASEEAARESFHEACGAELRLTRGSCARNLSPRRFVPAGVISFDMHIPLSKWQRALYFVSDYFLPSLPETTRVPPLLC